MCEEILVTGASGFIGKSLIPLLLEKGYKICGIKFENNIEPQENLRIETLDLLDINKTKEFLKKNNFSGLIHLAWYGDKKVHTHDINVDWVAASINIIRNFAGKKVLFAGSISEYDFKYGYFTEGITPLSNNSLYGQCKASLYNILSSYYKDRNIDFKWSRIFNLYGPNERPQRLMPSVINSCLKDEDVRVSDCLKFQDYLHVEDVANAILMQYENDIEGAVNICSGKPIQLRKIVNKITDLTDFKGKILWGAVPAAFGDDVVVGNNEILKSIGWKQKYSLDEGLKQTINWWKEKNKEIINV